MQQLHAVDVSTASAADAAGELRQMLRDNLESIHRDVIRCAARLTGDLDLDNVLFADLDAAKVVVQHLGIQEIESLLLRSVIGVEDGIKDVRDRVVLARAALDRLVS